MDGHILLLGVSHANNTSLHLSEHRSAPPDPALMKAASPLLVNGQRGWSQYVMLDDDDSDFEEIGEAFDATGRQRGGPVGAGTGRLMRARDFVDFGTEWMRRNCATR